MNAIADYAAVYETRFRPRRRGPRYALVLAVWAGLFLLRPRLALEILRERRADCILPRH